MTTINTTDDLLRLLDQNPEFREAVRRAILTEELIALPAAFGAFVSEMRAFQLEMRSFQSEVRVNLKTHTDDIGELKGIGLEAKLHDRGPSYIATLLSVYDVTRMRMAERDENSAEFNRQLREALETGVITMDEYRRVLRTDMIVSASKPGVAGTVYVAVEASYAVHRPDIRKVKQTKAILDKVFPDAETHTALYYMNIQPFIEDKATKDGIHLIEVRNME